MKLWKSWRGTGRREIWWQVLRSEIKPTFLQHIIKAFESSDKGYIGCWKKAEWHISGLIYDQQTEPRSHKDQHGVTKENEYWSQNFTMPWYMNSIILWYEEWTPLVSCVTSIIIKLHVSFQTIYGEMHQHLLSSSYVAITPLEEWGEKVWMNTMRNKTKIDNHSQQYAEKRAFQELYVRGSHSSQQPHLYINKSCLFTFF